VTIEQHCKVDIRILMNKKILLLCSLSTIALASDRHQEQKLQRKELGIGIFSDQGKKPSQEDIYALCGKGEFSCICDGHGGAGAALIVAELLPQAFLQQLAAKKGSDRAKEGAFKAAVQEVEERILNHSQEKSGSTLIAAYVGKNNFHLTWVGDSRIVSGSGQGITAYTQDHNLKSLLEKERLIKANATIYREVLKNDRSMVGPWRVRSLIPTRTIGGAPTKKECHKQICVYSRRGAELECESDLGVFYSTIIINVQPDQIIADPEYIKVPLDEKSPFIVLASDGLWDVMTNESVMQFIEEFDGQGMPMNDIAKILVINAQTRGSIDNITVIILDVRPRIQK
jgi:serine/threonine protein phosphatase PrpC